MPQYNKEDIELAVSGIAKLLNVEPVDLLLFGESAWVVVGHRQTSELVDIGVMPDVFENILKNQLFSDIYLATSNSSREAMLTNVSLANNRHVLVAINNIQIKLDFKRQATIYTTTTEHSPGVLLELRIPAMYTLKLDWIVHEHKRGYDNIWSPRDNT